MPTPRPAALILAVTMAAALLLTASPATAAQARVRLTDHIHPRDNPYMYENQLRADPRTRPLPGGLVTFRYRVTYTEKWCQWQITTAGYLRHVCGRDHGTTRRQWRVRVRLDQTGKGAASWPNIPASYVENDQAGTWTRHHERAVGTVTVRNHAGRVMQRFHARVRALRK